MHGQIGLAERDYIQLARQGSRIILEAATVNNSTAAEELKPAAQARTGCAIGGMPCRHKAGRVRGPFFVCEIGTRQLERKPTKLRRPNVRFDVGCPNRALDALEDVPRRSERLSTNYLRYSKPTCFVFARQEVR